MQPETRRVLYTRRLIACVAGLLWAMAFPNWRVAGFAWIAPGLLLASAAGASPREAFRCGYLAGTVHYLTGLYWLLYMPVPFYPILGWLSLALFLALYPALWTWACWKLWPQPDPDSAPPEEDKAPALSVVRIVQGVNWLARTRWAMLCGAGWVTWEMIQARLFSGFPWNLLGASQQSMSLLPQIGAQTGVYGISFLCVWASVCLFLTVLLLLASAGKRMPWQREIALPFLVVLLLCAKGWVEMISPPPPSRPVRIALIQPSIPQTMIWNEAESAARFEKLLSMSREALKNKPDLLVWPEAGAPYPIRYDTETRDKAAQLLSGTATWLCLGSDDVTFGVESNGQRFTNTHNSAFLMSPDGRLTQTYAKRQLVIFGEYIPLVKWLPFLKYFTPIGSGFTAGQERVAFQIPELGIRFAPLICFEDMFAGVARDQAQGDVDFLLNLTNDGWFGRSAQQWQHLQNASMRSIETGLPLVRCANNGVTGWVDSKGRIRDAGFAEPEGAYGVGIKIIDLPLPKTRPPQTTYRRHGDVFGWVCVAWFAIGVLRLRLRQTMAQRSPTPSNV